jgi:hypothetical protein
LFRSSSDGNRLEGDNDSSIRKRLIKASSVQLVSVVAGLYRVELHERYIIEELVERRKNRSIFMSKSNNPTARVIKFGVTRANQTECAPSLAAHRSLLTAH